MFDPRTTWQPKFRGPEELLKSALRQFIDRRVGRYLMEISCPIQPVNRYPSARLAQLDHWKCYVYGYRICASAGTLFL